MNDVQLSQGYRAKKSRQLTCHHYVPRNTWYSFHQPRKDERLSQPRRNSVVLKPGLLDYESSVLTTRSLLQLRIQRFHAQTLIICLDKLCDPTSFQDFQGPLQWLTSSKQDGLSTYEVDQGWPLDSQIFLWNLSLCKTD